MNILVLAQNQINISDFCPNSDKYDGHKDGERPIGTKIISLGRNGIWNGSIPFLVCEKCESLYLSTGLYAKVPVVTKEVLTVGVVVLKSLT